MVEYKSIYERPTEAKCKFCEATKNLKQFEQIEYNQEWNIILIDNICKDCFKKQKETSASLQEGDKNE